MHVKTCKCVQHHYMHVHMQLLTAVVSTCFYFKHMHLLTTVLSTCNLLTAVVSTCIYFIYMHFTYSCLYSKYMHLLNSCFMHVDRHTAVLCNVYSMHIHTWYTSLCLWCPFPYVCHALGACLEGIGFLHVLSINVDNHWLTTALFKFKNRKVR